MARSGMLDLIDDVRRYCDAGTSDYTLGTVEYWSNDQIQDLLDRYQYRFTQVHIEPISVNRNGTVYYFDYALPRRSQYIEGTASGTAYWAVYDSNKDIVSSGYTVETDRITFDTDRAGSSLYLSYTMYDTYGAISDIWRLRAAHLSSRYDVKTDNHELKRSQYVKHCISMSEFYGSRSSFSSGVSIMRRHDATS